MDNGFFVYVLQSYKDNKRYVGMTIDIVRRFHEHNAGKVISTKARRPFKLVLQERYNTREEARQREKYFKTASGRRWIDKRVEVEGSTPRPTEQV